MTSHRSMGLALGTTGLIALAKNAAKAFMEDEVGATKLANAVKNLGMEMETPAIEKYIEALSTTAAVADDRSISAEGDERANMETGDVNKFAASGDDSQLAASGDDSKLAASGDDSQLAASGDDSKLAASGYGSKLAASGDDSKLAASGDDSKLAASGKKSISVCAGLNGSAFAGEDGCIALAWWDSDKERYRLNVGYVGEGGIEEGKIYKLDNHHNFIEV